TVPPVVGMSARDAELLLRKVDLQLGQIRDGKPQTPAGIVQQQNPSAGSARPANGRVDVWLSTNQVPPTPKVPSVIGLTIDQAKQRLDPLHMRLGAIHQQPAHAKPGTIFRQNPQEGSPAATGGQVEVWVAPPKKVATPTPLPIG